MAEGQEAKSAYTAILNMLQRYGTQEQFKCALGLARDYASAALEAGLARTANGVGGMGYSNFLKELQKLQKKDAV